jgi:hypothetical protein
MRPVLQALVLADRVYTDQSGKKIIAGTFNQLMIGKLQVPTVDTPDGGKRALVPGGLEMGCPWVYISLTDIVDGTEIVLQFLNITKNRPLMQTGFRLDPHDRLATVEIVVPLPPIANYLEGPGTYSLDVLWGEELLGSHRIRVVELPTADQGG